MEALTVAEILARPTAERAPTMSEAAQLGWEPELGESIRQVAVWLRDAMPDDWCEADEGHLQHVAYWLIGLRDRLVERRIYDPSAPYPLATAVTGAGVLGRPAPARSGASLGRPRRRRRELVSIVTQIRISVGVWVTLGMARLPWISGRF